MWRPALFVICYQADGEASAWCLLQFKSVATLTKSWRQGRWVAKLKGYDLLGQVTQWQYYVSSQGRTEYWTNNMRRYVLLSLAYRFSLTPKKK